MAKGKFAVGAIIGAAAGIVAGILTAPKSGKQTRGDITKKAQELKKKGSSELKKVEKTVERDVAAVRKNATKAVNDLKGTTKKTAANAVAKTPVKKTTKK